MKIGVDVRLLSRSLTGIGRYTMEMCCALQKSKNISLNLYSPAPLPNAAISRLGKSTIRTLNWHNGILRQVWGETVLPYWVKQDEIDVFWGPAHRLPYFLPDDIARVVTIHDLVWKYAGETMRPLSRLLEKTKMPQAVKSADYVVADSHSTAKDVVSEFKVSHEIVSVIGLGANIFDGDVTITKLQEAGIKKPYILFIGTMEPRKNLSRLLEAYSSLSEETKEKASLVIAGDKGWGGVEVKDLVKRFQVEQHVKILGYVDDSTLSSLYANAHFLVMPSLYEGFGLPILEAMSFGIPVLTANNSSLPEVAGDAGILVDALSVESIAQGLDTLICDQAVRDNLASKAKASAARHDWDSAAEKLLSVFEKAALSRK